MSKTKMIVRQIKGTLKKISAAEATAGSERPNHALHW